MPAPTQTPMPAPAAAPTPAPVPVPAAKLIGDVYSTPCSCVVTHGPPLAPVWSHMAPPWLLCGHTWPPLAPV
eukprot:363664-Chlamydomonas_euryale.AAC.1